MFQNFVIRSYVIVVVDLSKRFMNTRKRSLGQEDVHTVHAVHDDYACGGLARPTNLLNMYWFLVMASGFVVQRLPCPLLQHGVYFYLAS